MTTKAELLRAIREKCLDCCVHQSKEVRLCPVYKCALHSFRMGKDPHRSPNRGYAKSRAYTGNSEQHPLKRNPAASCSRGRAILQNPSRNMTRIRSNEGKASPP